jgi:hypothetical protein
MPLSKAADKTKDKVASVSRHHSIMVWAWKYITKHSRLQHYTQTGDKLHAQAALSLQKRT